MRGRQLAAAGGSGRPKVAMLSSVNIKAYRDSLLTCFCNQSFVLEGIFSYLWLHI